MLPARTFTKKKQEDKQKSDNNRNFSVILSSWLSASPDRHMYEDWLPRYYNDHSENFTNKHFFLGKIDESTDFKIRCNYVIAYSERTSIKAEFKKLAEEWLTEITHISSISEISMHPSYQRIIGMGSNVIPLILEELSKNSGHWFWALSAITGEDPVDPDDAGDIKSMTQAWLELGEIKGWI